MIAHHSNLSTSAAERRIWPAPACDTKFTVPILFRQARLHGVVSSPGHYIICLGQRHAVRARTFGRQGVVTES